MATQNPSAAVSRPLKIRCVDSSLLPAAAKSVSNSSSTSPLKLLDHFSQSHLALALVIQKSKPGDMSTKDYCTSLKRSIWDTEGSPSSTRRIVDSGEFWREQCERALREKKALEHRVMVLGDQQPELDIVATNVPFQNRLPQRSFNNMESVDIRIQPPLQDDQEQDQAEQKSLSLSSYLFRLGARRKTLESLVHDSDQPTRLDDIVKASSSIFSMLRTIISDFSFILCLLKTNDEDRRSLAIFRQLLSQMDLSYRCCFDALNELSRTIPGRQKRPALMYHLATFFDHVLKHLHNISTAQFNNEEQPPYKERCRGKRQKIVRREEEFAVNKYSAQMLVSILQNIKWETNTPSHQEVFEGIMYSVLNHTGRLLSLAVFEEHVAASKLPGNITTRKDSDPPFSDDRKYESRYLIEVLRAVMDVHNDLSRGQKPNLVRQAEKRIQATLINGAIGGLADTLKQPIVPEGALHMADENSTIEQYGSEWLVEKVWTLVGWNLN